jgi:lipopolysaccharide transport system permease protein
VTTLSASARPSLSPLSLARSVLQHRHLLSRLVVRDVVGKYQGSFAGVLWSLITPLMMLCIYMFVFGWVFNPRRAAPDANLTEFGLMLFAGMLVHGLLSECLIRSASAVLAQPNYVKKVVFPVELLPLTVVGSACVQYLIGLSVLLVALVFFQGLSLQVLLLPVVMLPLLLLCVGVALAVSALAVYLRDIAQVTGLASTVLMFLSPVFYPLESLPKAMQGWILLNPLSVPIEASRAVLLRGVQPDWMQWGLYSLVCLGLAWFGWAVFQGTRRGFADVL